jgi:lipoprotein NlpD
LRLPGPVRVVGLCCALLAGCADTVRHGEQTYVVRPQDTLYSIAWRHDLDYRELARLNHIGADYRIEVGQTLLLRSERGASAAAPAKPVARAGKPSVTPAAPPAITGKWVWPTDHSSSPRPVPGGGILLLGTVGQDVRAASAGRVVYTGSGLRGYGNLIIIKHAESLLSAYAHNRDVLVHEGQEVSAGQTIARMGEGPNQVAALYFDIRENGKPTDALRYLNAQN